jgi:predicted MFS family arabinose efflux permease
VVIVQAGIAWVFALNALTFVAFLVALSRLRLEPPLARTPAERPPMLQALADGLRYTAAHPLIGPILLLHAMIGISARPFIELLPGFVDQVFGRGASGLAMLSSSIGIGAVVGALWLAGRSNDGHLIKALLISSLLVPLSTLAFSMVTWFPAAVACVTLAGFAMVVAGVGTQTVIQMAVEETMRGRVLSLFGLVFRSAPALGALAMGAASELVGLPLPVGLGSLVGIAACALIWRHRPALEAAAAGD